MPYFYVRIHFNKAFFFLTWIIKKQQKKNHNKGTEPKSSCNFIFSVASWLYYSTLELHLSIQRVASGTWWDYWKPSSRWLISHFVVVFVIKFLKNCCRRISFFLFFFFCLFVFYLADWILTNKKRSKKETKNNKKKNNKHSHQQWMKFAGK